MMILKCGRNAGKMIDMVKYFYFEKGYKVSDILELYKGRLTYADIKKIIGG